MLPDEFVPSIARPSHKFPLKTLHRNAQFLSMLDNQQTDAHDIIKRPNFMMPRQHLHIIFALKHMLWMLEIMGKFLNTFMGVFDPVDPCDNDMHHI